MTALIFQTGEGDIRHPRPSFGVRKKGRRKLRQRLNTKRLVGEHGRDSTRHMNLFRLAINTDDTQTREMPVGHSKLLIVEFSLLSPSSLTVT